ncbi:MAG TPA: GNAT family N-acetyltransferase [Micromonosporaceae bacterium]|nr:GNAT family N-acetyltransferase [Micromonosporaceae bacterium]
MPPPEFHAARFADLDARTLHDLLRLRGDVFVVEQECAYPDIDGRDIEPQTRHLWLARNGAPVAYLRILVDAGGVARIGRVAVAKAARGEGLAGRLMDEALTLVGDRTCVLEAQSYLVAFYARYGFAVTGAKYVDDGIPHVPMRREPGPGAVQPAQGRAATSSATDRRRPV